MSRSPLEIVGTIGLVMLLGLILGRASFMFAIWMVPKIHVFHKKKWVLVYRCDGPFCPGKGYKHMHSFTKKVQVGRWVCAKEGCTAMGEECLGLTEKGILTVHNGNLVPDEKAWSNPPGIH